MKLFFSGGCKNGKSSLAEDAACRLAEREGLPLYYLATMIPADSEDEQRIARHRHSRRHKGFQTIEQGREIHKALDRAEAQGVFLLDSVTALVANEMFLPNGGVCDKAAEKVQHGLSALLCKAAHFVAVSDYIYSDAHIYDEMTQGFLRALAQTDRYLAQQSEVVAEVCATNIYFHRGGEMYEALF